MKLARGDMWSAYEKADLFVFTANNSLNKKGELIMGKGIAKQVKQRFPQLPKVFGDKIAPLGKYVAYYLVQDEETKVAAFQVKGDWRRDANLGQIRISVSVLNMFIEHFGFKEVHMNFPGIGAGGLKREDVLPIIEELPDVVTVWEYPH